MNCHKCNMTLHHPDDSFCSHCGAEVIREKLLPYVGKLATRSVFRITFNPIEAEFNSKEAADSAAYHSCWDEDRSFTGYTIQDLGTAVPKDKYPFICECKRFVSDTVNGKCEGCGRSVWHTR